jgi:hypothetical protein
VSRFLLFFYVLMTSTHSLASRNPVVDQDGYVGPGFAWIFLFGVVPILFWVFGKFLQNKEKNDDVKKFEKEKKLREHTDQLVKEFAEKNIVQIGEKNNIHPKKDAPKPTVTTPHPIKELPKVEEKPKPKKEFPKLTNKEREYALFRLGMGENGSQKVECHKCGRVDLLRNFDESSAGNRFRFCNVCNCHFELDLPDIDKSESKLIDVFYLRCFGCGDIVKRLDLLDSSAGYGFKKCPSCRKYNFQTYELSPTWYEQFDENIGDGRIGKGESESDFYPKSRIALEAINEIRKENHRLKIIKKYYRTTPYLRHCGWRKKPHKEYHNTRRVSRVKRLVDWWINRQPRIFT